MTMWRKFAIFAVALCLSAVVHAVATIGSWSV